MEIVERKQAEEAMRDSEEKYRTILEKIEDGYYEVDLTGTLTFFNDSACKIRLFQGDTNTRKSGWFQDHFQSSRCFLKFDKTMTSLHNHYRY